MNQKGPEGPPPKGASAVGLPKKGPGGMPGAPPSGPVPYRRLFRCAVRIVSAAPGLFLVSTALTILVQMLGLYNMQVLANVVSSLRPAGGGANDGQPDSFISRLHLLPTDARTSAVLFASMVVGLLLLRLLDRFLTVITDSAMVGRLQRQLHDTLITLGPSYHSRHDVGETMMIVTRYAQPTQSLLRDLLAFPVVKGVVLVTSIALLVNNLNMLSETSSWLKAALVGALVLLPVISMKLSGSNRGAFSLVRDSEFAVANEFTNSASLPLEVQLMGAGEQRSEAFGEKVRANIRTKVRATLRAECFSQIQSTIPVMLQGAFLIYGAFVALDSPNPAKAAAAILAIYLFVPMAIDPLQQIVGFFNGLNQTWPTIQSVVDLLEAKPEVSESPGAGELTAADDVVSLENVTFSYAKGGKRILDGLSYSFEKGKVTAIVALAGGGKSTILNLVSRLRDPDSGKILIGSTDVRNVKLTSLRRNVVKVSQFPLFLADTVRANMLLARRDATDAEIEAACRRTGIWTVLENAAGPGGSPLDYRLPRAVSEGLSGGQRRLLAVTRALLCKPTVLLLDEPTTGEDKLLIRELAHLLRNACQGVTVLLVDHEMEFVYRLADRVCCLENGGFTTVGTPVELEKTSNLFQRLLEAGRSDPRAPEPCPDAKGPIPGGA